jgi:outer membrane protein assembly factor BamE (lipoprotein component of BamABCDE complex)
VAKWVLIVGGALIVVLIIVAVLVVLDEVEKSEEKAAQVDPAKFRSLQGGESRAEVRAALGEPEDTSPKAIEGFGQLRCWYYGLLAERTYEVCFKGERLAFAVRL